jgi:poly(3-hydroxybutyrate) depolymerase
MRFMMLRTGSGWGRGREALLLALLLCGTEWSYGQSIAAESTPSHPVSADCSEFAQMASVLASHAADIPTTGESASLSCRHGPIQQSIVVNGVARTFMLYVPRRYRPGESALVIALHGRTGSGAAFEGSSNLDEKADQVGFAAAYPDGLVDATGTADWNYFYDPFFINGPDDVSFLRDIIDTLQAQIHPDRRRIYATGTSAGGFMVQRAGVELSDRVAAIGVVEGGIFVFAPNSPQSVPPAAAPISVLILKGDQDVPNQYCGAVFPTFGIVEASADQDFDYWTGAAANECSDIEPAAPLCLSVGVGDAQANVTPGMPSSLVMKKASRCKQHTEVRLYRLLGGQDKWNLNPLNIPGNVPFNPELNAHTGVTTNDILWKFFTEHPKKDPAKQND